VYLFDFNDLKGVCQFYGQFQFLGADFTLLIAYSFGKSLKNKKNTKNMLENY
jgi:hypothetical protein